MAEINIEKKKSVWPWILAAVVVLLLIWLVVQALDRDDDRIATTDQEVVTTPVYTDPATDRSQTTMPATDATMTGSALEGFAGLYTSNNMQLNLNANGTYTMQESPAGEGRGTWMHDASANALHLVPADGSQDRFFRVEGDSMLTPLNANGEPAAQMAMLTRQAEVTR